MTFLRNSSKTVSFKKRVFKTNWLNGTVLFLFSRWIMSATTWTAARQAFLSFTTSQSLLKLCPLRQWYHPTISSSVTPFSSCPQSFPVSGSFPMSQFFPSDGQSIRVSASTSVLPVNIQDWFPYDWLICSPCSPKDSQGPSPTSQIKSNHYFALSFPYSPTLTSLHDYWKNHSFD